MKPDMRFGWLMLRVFALLVTVFYAMQNGVDHAFFGYCVACVFTWILALYSEKKITAKEN